MAKPLPRGSSSPGSPGVSGALKDAIGAIADATAPRSIVQRKARLQQQEDEAGIGRRRNNQSTDSNNGL